MDLRMGASPQNLGPLSPLITGLIPLIARLTPLITRHITPAKALASATRNMELVCRGRVPEFLSVLVCLGSFHWVPAGYPTLPALF